MWASCDFLTFFRPTPWGQTPTNFDAIWLRRRGFTQGCAFCSKNRYISYPLISRPPKGSKFCKFLDFEIFRSISVEVPRANTPYSSTELNESGIVNRQSGGEKLKYILKFYIRGTCHVILLHRAGSHSQGRGRVRLAQSPSGVELLQLYRWKPAALIPAPMGCHLGVRWTDST